MCLENVDFSCTFCEVTFKTGQVSEGLDILIINNDVFEGTDHFSVEVQPPDYVIIGDPSKAAVLIIDLDGRFSSLSV